MSRTFFAGPLDTAATYWRVFRRDGVTLGFTTHDRDLAFGDMVHRAAPGMLPSAIRLSLDLADDDASVEGALSHAAISESDLAAGRYDGAAIEIGVVDWENRENQPIYFGTIATVSREGAGFTAVLRSAKALLEIDPIPQTGPSCRARFCGPGCNLNPRLFESRASVLFADFESNSLALDAEVGDAYRFGEIRLTQGPQAGQILAIVAVSGRTITLDRPLAVAPLAGARVLLRQGCDRTIATCADRFGNAVNFRGEPFVPGADLLTQYPTPR